MIVQAWQRYGCKSGSRQVRSLCSAPQPNPNHHHTPPHHACTSTLNPTLTLSFPWPHVEPPLTHSLYTACIAQTAWAILYQPFTLMHATFPFISDAAPPPGLQCSRTCTGDAVRCLPPGKPRASVCPSYSKSLWLGVPCRVLAFCGGGSRCRRYGGGGVPAEGLWRQVCTNGA